MAVEDLVALREAINQELHYMHQMAEFGVPEAAACADGLRIAAMLVDKMVVDRYRTTYREFAAEEAARNDCSPS